ncbi:MAG: PQQ-binding-like beta-propeller repeat protein [Planctomycetales bacterium]|nr:PQQ-binding-like beta-propeller repeat protein [Planctomycetales bacterium]
MNSLITFRSILHTAIVAGVFSVLVLILLLVDGASRLNKVPMEASQFVELRKQFVEEPNNVELRQQIQVMDLALRQEYFREQHFTVIGSYLLIGGIVLTLIFGKWATILRRKLPKPKPKLPGPDSDELLSHTGLRAVVLLIVALIGTSWAMNATYKSSLPTSIEELASLNATSNQTLEDAKIEEALALPDLPTPEEWQHSWPNFRGPQGTGISMHASIPTTWDGSSGDGILWKAPVPLPGVNSPIVWRDHVFLSGATDKERAVFCFDALTGDIQWRADIKPDPLVVVAEVKTTDDTGYAAPTMATDGRLVFAMFGDGLLVAVDFQGKERWRQSLGIPQRNSYGHASSLVTHQGAVIVQYDHGTPDDELSKLMSFDGATGNPNWETVRSTPASWSSPIVTTSNESAQIITCCDPWVIAYSPKDGKEIWRVNCLERAEVGPSPVYSDDVVYVCNDTAVLAAIRCDGTGDVTDTHVVWTVEDGLPDTCSPLVSKDFVMTVASYGALFCFDKKDGGDPIWEEDLGADFISSPSLVGDHVYLFGRDGSASIYMPTADECQRVGEAELGEDCVTCPAFQDGRIIIRGVEHLFCIGKTESESS